MILDRVEADRGDSIPDKMTWQKLWKHLADPVLWLFGLALLLFVRTDTNWTWRIIAFMFLASTVPAYAMGFFITIILQGMGFSDSLSLILTAPPGILAVSTPFSLSRINCQHYSCRLLRVSSLHGSPTRRENVQSG